jgi:hypothetical protein
MSAADTLAREAVTEACNSVFMWKRGAALLSPTLAAVDVARQLVFDPAVSADTRAALLPFLDRAAAAIGLQQLKQLDLWQGAA